MKKIITKFASIKGRLITLMWRLIAVALFVVACLVWPRAFEPLEDAFISIICLLIGAGIMDYIDNRKS